MRSLHQLQPVVHAPHKIKVSTQQLDAHHPLEAVEVVVALMNTQRQDVHPPEGVPANLIAMAREDHAEPQDDQRPNHDQQAEAMEAVAITITLPLAAHLEVAAEVLVLAPKLVVPNNHLQALALVVLVNAPRKVSIHQEAAPPSTTASDGATAIKKLNRDVPPELPSILTF